MFQLTQRRPAAQNAAIIALLAVLAIVLTACSSSGESKATYIKSESGISSTMTIYAEGDNLTKQSIESIINYKEAGIKDKAEAQKTFAPVVEEYKGVTGLSYNVEYTDTTATEALTVNYKTADLKKIAELTGSEFDETNKDSKVSLKETIATVEASGFTKKG